MAYTCARCGYATSVKGNLKKHFYRKTPCTPSLSEVDISHLRCMFEDVCDAIKRFQCRWCEKGFSSSQGRYQHQQHHCMHRPKERSCSTIKEELETLRTMVTQLTNQGLTSSTTNTNCNNTTQNIQVNVVNAFGKEDTSHLTQPFLDRCVRRTNQGIIDLLEKLHFDPQTSGRNANVRCCNKKLPLCETNDGTRWKYARKETVLNEMIDKGHTILQEHLDDNHDAIQQANSASLYEHIMAFYGKLADKDKNTWEQLLTDAYILILNHTPS